MGKRHLALVQSRFPNMKNLVSRKVKVDRSVAVVSALKFKSGYFESIRYLPSRGSSEQIKILSGIFEVSVREVKNVHGKKVVDSAVFYGYKLDDDVVVFASEGLGVFRYRFYLRLAGFDIFPLFLVVQSLSEFEMWGRYGSGNDKVVVGL